MKLSNFRLTFLIHSPKLPNFWVRPSLLNLLEMILSSKRFELFLKEKYEGGLRSSSFSGASKMSESERARERLDFEAAAEAIAKFEQSAKDSLQKKQKSTEFSIIGDEHFVSSSGGQISKDEDKLVGKVLPTREEFQWRPSPLLCKRFDILDPYMGKPPPIPRPRSKMDALIFMVDSNLDSKKEAILLLLEINLPYQHPKTH
ncbi:hypothetical protein HPP92_002786 [Vanilla planifolia]|uniref:Uncharacterized protein n=1 Tax=Vanilla planifolia TaxID=51239 RepID=A0A835S250_VANPL|nr:hypothetical protein HPP92_002786 [Vanilla planifolia]